ncbi:MAG: helix-turn-helix domain-containing protein [Clostridia bacterium]|nr:helix-turn-helix domain-containing protein [Lachnospiraceae bacterium]MCI7304448.1 helix-turn-helix domain-containing protein [Clostridia bacterium]
MEDSKHCGSAVVNVISQIRRKIGEGYIETKINSGYRFMI